MHYQSRSYRIVSVLIHLFLMLIAAACLFPILNVLAVSFSSKGPAMAGQVFLWPVEFTLKSYEYVFSNKNFGGSFGNSLLRIVLGVSIQMAITILVAYPLSKENKDLPSRTVYAWVFVFTMLFNGGLIPTFLVVKATGIMNSVWALVLPAAVNAFNIVLMLNFFRTLPRELEESSFMDGAGHWRTLWSIFLPISLPGIATVTLFVLVFHWNSWFDGLIYLNRPVDYPLATYLQAVISLGNQTPLNQSLEQARLLAEISSRTTTAAQILIASVPILVVYPFLQKYFVKGLVLGSVKG